MPPKDVDRLANSVDPDQTAPYKQSDQNLYCLFRNIIPIFRIFTVPLLHGQDLHQIDS